MNMRWMSPATEKARAIIAPRRVAMPQPTDGFSMRERPVVWLQNFIELRCIEYQSPTSIQRIPAMLVIKRHSPQSGEALVLSITSSSVPSAVRGGGIRAFAPSL